MTWDTLPLFSRVLLVLAAFGVVAFVVLVWPFIEDWQEHRAKERARKAMVREAVRAIREHQRWGRELDRQKRAAIREIDREDRR